MVDNAKAPYKTAAASALPSMRIKVAFIRVVNVLVKVSSALAKKIQKYMLFQLFLQSLNRTYSV